MIVVQSINDDSQIMAGPLLPTADSKASSESLTSSNFTRRNFNKLCARWQDERQVDRAVMFRVHSRQISSHLWRMNIEDA